MIYKFVIAGILIQCESEFPLAVSEFDSGFLSDSDKNPEFFMSLRQTEYKEPSNQKCLFQYDDLIVTCDQYGHETRYFMFPENKQIYGSACMDADNHIHAAVYTEESGLAAIGIPFWNFFMLDKLIQKKRGLILHSSYICEQGEAILFSAPSGVGKSTQASLWNQYRGSDIINGDRSLLMKRKGVWMANGFPFHGSSEFCRNESYPIKAIIVLRQDKTNHIEMLSVRNQFNCIMTELICNSWDKAFVLDTMEQVENLISEVPVYMYYCNMEESAVTCLCDFLKG